MRRIVMSTALLSLALAACGSADTAEEATDDAVVLTESAVDEPSGIVAVLQTADGTPVGSAIATPVDDGIRIGVNVDGIEPGTHGVHVHMTGSCEAPDFASAGGHWNPASKQHGLENPQGAHAGDMPNLTVNTDGTGRLDYTLEGATLDGLLDVDGSAFVVHAEADDQKTDPSGNSGDRIACGVFTAS